MDDQILEQERDGYLISTDRAKLDLVAMHNYLASSYWSPGLPMQVLEKSVAGSLCFGVFQTTANSGSKATIREQVGLARVITDGATFAYLCDVYVLESHRGKGLAKWLMDVVLSHPDLQGLRRFVLITRDAHGLYEKCGFTALARPEGYMEIHRPNAYLPEADSGDDSKSDLS